VDFYRSVPPEPEVEGWSGFDLAAYLEEIPNGSPSPYEIVARQEVREMIRAAIRELPPDQAQAMELRFVGELSLQEIAAEMHRSEGAVKALLHRAVRNVRARRERQSQTATVARAEVVQEEATPHERRGTVRLRR